MPLFLTSDVLVEILSESDLRVLPATDPGNGYPYLATDGTLRVDSGAPLLPGPTVEAGKFWMTDGLGGTVYGEPELLTAEAIEAALGYLAADDAEVVHLAGTETITGDKRFNAQIGLNGYAKLGGVSAGIAGLYAADGVTLALLKTDSVEFGPNFANGSSRIYGSGGYARMEVYQASGAVWHNVVRGNYSGTVSIGSATNAVATLLAGPTVYIGSGVASDTALIRESAGLLRIGGDAGLRVRNLLNTADAAITAAGASFSGAVYLSAGLFASGGYHEFNRNGTRAFAVSSDGLVSWNGYGLGFATGNTTVESYLYATTTPGTLKLTATNGTTLGAMQLRNLQFSDTTEIRLDYNSSMTGYGIDFLSAGNEMSQLNLYGWKVCSIRGYGWASANNLASAYDTFLLRPAAGTVGVYQADGTTLGYLHANTVSVLDNGIGLRSTNVRSVGFGFLDGYPVAGGTMGFGHYGEVAALSSNGQIGWNSHSGVIGGVGPDTILKRAGVANLGVYAANGTTPAGITAGAATFSGFVGIGTTPTYGIDVSQATGNYYAARFKTPGNKPLLIWSDSGGSGITNADPYEELIYLSPTSHSIGFYTNGVSRATISSTGATTFSGDVILSGNVAANSGLVTVTGTTSSKVFLANASYTGQLAVENSVGVSFGRLSGKGIAVFNSCSPISIDASGNITYPDGNSSLGESGWRWGGVWTTTLNASGAATFAGSVTANQMSVTDTTAPVASRYLIYGEGNYGRKFGFRLLAGGDEGGVHADSVLLLAAGGGINMAPNNQSPGTMLYAISGGTQYLNYSGMAVFENANVGPTLVARQRSGYTSLIQAQLADGTPKFTVDSAGDITAGAATFGGNVTLSTAASSLTGKTAKFTGDDYSPDAWVKIQTLTNNPNTTVGCGVEFGSYAGGKASIGYNNSLQFQIYSNFAESITFAYDISLRATTGYGIKAYGDTGLVLRNQANSANAPLTASTGTFSGAVTGTSFNGVALTTGGSGTQYLDGTGTYSTPPVTSPAGSNTQIQFNNAGAFGASSSLTWDGTTLVVTGAATFSGNTQVSGWLQFGGTTASYPMFQRFGTRLDLKLADNSGYASMWAGGLVLYGAMSSQDITPTGDNLYDFGSAISRYKDGYFAGSVIAGEIQLVSSTTKLVQNSSTQVDVRADSGFRIRNAANSANANLAAAQGTFTGVVYFTDAQTLLARSSSGILDARVSTSFRVRNQTDTGDGPITAGAATFSSITCPWQAGDGTGEQFGYGAATSQVAVAVGRGANNSGAASVSVGYNATSTYAGVGIGYAASAGWSGVAIGFGASSQTTYGYGGVAVGYYAYAHDTSIALGNVATSGPNQCYLGSNATMLLRQSTSARWTQPATGQRNSEVGDGSGSVWQAGYREEYNVAGIRTGFYGVTPVAQSTGWAAANYTPTKTIDPTTSTMADLINLVATLTQRLIDVGVISA